ncbi:hypothetical protein LSH36_1175g00014, partial [Paralvinella palmiformis]
MALCGCMSNRGKKIPKNELLPQNMSGGGQDIHKLDLMAENSSLKLRLAALEREKSDLESRLQYAQLKIEELQSRLNEQTLDMKELRLHISKTSTAPSSPNMSGKVISQTPSSPSTLGKVISETPLSPNLSGKVISQTPSSQNMSDVSHDRTMERERTLERLKRKHSEVEKLKKAVESLMLTNTEKDHYIDDLTKEVKKYRRLEELSEIGLKTGESQTLGTRQTNAPSLEQTLLWTEGYNNVDHTPKDGSNTLLPNATSTPVGPGSLAVSGMNTSQRVPCTVEPSRTQSSTVGVGRSSSCENIKGKNGTPPLLRGQVTGYGGTLPKDARLLSDKQTTSCLHTDSNNRSPSSSHPVQREPVRTNSQRNHHRPRASTLPKGKPPVGPSGTPTGPGSQTPGALTPQGSVRHRGDSPARRGQINRQGSNCSTSGRAKRGFMSFGKGFFKKSAKWSSSAPNLGDGASFIGMLLLISLAWLYTSPNVSNSCLPLSLSIPISFPHNNQYC